MLAIVAWACLLGAGTATDLADSLFEHGLYEEAATEYERFLFQHPGDSFAPTARRRLVQSYARNGELSRAEERLADLPAAVDGWEARFDLALGYVRQREFGNARAELQRLRSASGDSSRGRKASHELGWLATEQGDFGLAVADFWNCPGIPRWRRNAAGFVKLPVRSPVLAMLCVNGRARFGRDVRG